MGEFGLALIERELPKLIEEYSVDFVIAQGENVTNGKGLSLLDFRRLQAAGVNACTGGNWTLYNDSIFDALDHSNEPVVRPANYPLGTPGLPYKYVTTPQGSVLVVSLMGSIVGRDADKPTDNPLKIIDAILKNEQNTPKVATIVNLHGDFSSEKVVIGLYLDGRASIVVGDHWHVPTADTQILPGGTAHITDVGMCGSFDSSLGVQLSSVVPRWRDGKPTANVLQTTGRTQINGLLTTIDAQSGLAVAAEHIRRIYT